VHGLSKHLEVIVRYFILAILLISCGYGPIRPINPFDKQEHDKVLEYEHFESYVAGFENDWGLKVTDLIIEFTDIKQKKTKKEITLGTCTTGYNTTPIIHVDINRWQDMKEISRKILLYHELGHCVLFRGHVKGENTSLMNPILISSFTFLANEDYFIAELFDPDKLVNPSIFKLEE